MGISTIITYDNFMKKKLLSTILLSLLYLCIHAQEKKSNSDSITTKKPSHFTTQYWLQDLTTIPIREGNKRFPNTFNGVRLLFEPQFGNVFQTVDNRIVTNDYNGLLKFGCETNLLMGYVSLQGLLIFPTTVQFDELGMIRADQHIKDPTGRVSVDYGAGVGLSFFDGVIAVGYASLFFDKRNFTNMGDIPRTTFNYQTNFFYFAIQPVSAIKTVIQNIKSVSK